VRELILHRYDVLLCVRAVGNYLKRWGFTPQKPLKKAYEQSPQQPASVERHFLHTDVKYTA
jgi:transposase